MKKFAILLPVLFLIFFYSCSKDESNPVTPGGTSGTLGGNWTVDNVQIVSAPPGSSASAIMKQSLVPFGAMSGSFAGYLDITLGAEKMNKKTSGLPYVLSYAEFFGNVGFFSDFSDTYRLNKSTDGGVTWVQMPKVNSSTTNINAVAYSVVNSSLIFAAYDSSSAGIKKLFKSNNGGLSWDLINPNLGIRQMSGYQINTSLFFVNENVGYSISSEFPLKLYKTTNGGVNWFVVSNTIQSTSLHFDDEMNGYQINGDKFYKTTDGGATWTSYSFGSSVYANNRVQFIGSTGWVNVYDYNYGDCIYKTTNGGINWSRIDGSLYDFRFKNVNEAYGIVDGIPLKTTNGGLNWIPYPSDANSGLSRVHIINDEVVFTNSAGAMLTPSGTSDSTKWTSVGQLTNAALKIITGSKGDEVYANGEYSISGSNIVFTTSNYSKGTNVAVGSGIYAFDGAYLNITLNLPNGEVWKVRLRRK